MSIAPLPISYHRPGPRRAEELQRRLDDLRRRACQCRDLADSALSAAGRETLSELAISFSDEAAELERLLSTSREAAHCAP